MDSVYDLIIVGGGPAGLSAAIYAGRSERKTLVLEKGSYGGRINDTYEVRNYPGTMMDSGQHLMERFREHAASHPTVEWKRTTVTGIRKEEDVFLVSTKRRGDFMARSVILDLGTRPRELNIKGEKEFTGRGVAYCATCDAEFFRDKEIYVLGAGDQAVEESDYLTGFASRVTIVVLQGKGHLDCGEAAAERAYRNPKIDFVWNTTVDEIKGNGHVSSLVLKNVDTGEVREVRSDGLFLFVGMVPQTELVKDLAVRDESGYIPVSDRMETNVPGLYAVGDCTVTFLRQVVTSAANGAVAAVASERYVKEMEELRHILSPDSGSTAFIFYNPYNNEDIKKSAELSQMLGGQWKLYRQDITRQNLLYQNLKIRQTVSAAFYKDGKLQEIKYYNQEDMNHGTATCISTWSYGLQP